MKTREMKGTLRDEDRGEAVQKEGELVEGLSLAAVRFET